MANLNRIILVGRPTADPETRNTMDGLPMAKFKLAVSRPQNGTDLIDVIAWRQLAEVCGDLLKKGSLVLVEGRIQNRSFEDQSGQRRWVTEVVAQNMKMMEKPSVARPQLAPSDAEGSPVEDNQQKKEEEAVKDIDLASDLPF